MRLTPSSLPAAITLVGAAALLLLAGCATAPPPANAPTAGTRDVGRAPPAVLAQDGRDGADARPPPNLDQVPDATPRVDTVRVGGPNKPYEALGRTYVPFLDERSFVERGLASWYGRKFHGRRTSSGEPYDMYAMTAAHPTLPLPSYVRVRNPANGREVVVRVNDRGPFHPGRIIDLSYTAAFRLDLLRGVAPVEVERITPEEIRAGTWRRPAAAGLALAAPSTGSPVPASVGAVVTPSVGAVVTPNVGAVGTPNANVVGTPNAGAVVASAVGAGVASMVDPVPTSNAAPVVASKSGSVVTADAGSSITPATVPIALPGSGPVAAAEGGFWVQLGAFRQRDGALAYQRRIAGEFDWLSPWLAVVGEATLFRLQAGPYPSRDQAREAADSIRAALQLVPLIVERR